MSSISATSSARSFTARRTSAGPSCNPQKNASPPSMPSCAEGGVLGILPGLIGCIQATEAVKLILGKGSTLVGRLLLYDALQMSFQEFKVRRNPNCPLCGDKPTITKLIDYEQFCGMAS